jgi:hypothetical protein
MQQYDMLKPLAQLLQTAIENELPHLQAITDSVAEEKFGSKWSRKEELGHLIDSASNNHLRFVRAALEREFHGPSYDQNGSVIIHGYQEQSWVDLLEFWHRYNYLIVEVVARIPEEKLETPCTIGSSAPVTLHFLITDYVRHMQHHLDHILRREVVTPYP